jgi:hypothetical protein
MLSIYVDATRHIVTSRRITRILSSPAVLDFLDSYEYHPNPAVSCSMPSASGTLQRAPGINSTPIRGITARRALGLQSGLTRGTGVSFFIPVNMICNGG